jgi:predicted naringenin-chalcone synthase
MRRALMLVSAFRLQRPCKEAPQEAVLDWLAGVHARAEAPNEEAREQRDAFRARMQKLIRRVCCGPDKIESRGFAAPELFESGAIVATAERTDVYARVVDAAFESLYADVTDPPDDLVHVTCTGYVSPSGAQRIVSTKGWGAQTRVTHAYHMGCYAAIPALRIALGCLSSPARRRAGRVDIVHTELCSLHFDPAAHTPEQLVVQSLFADGIARYSLSESGGSGLRLLALHEAIASGSQDEMRWSLGDRGMRMALSRSVPDRLATEIESFATEVFARARLDFGKERRSCIFAIHPGGPKIIDRVREALDLSDAQVAASQRTFRRYGNMSSATLPHIWSDVVADAAVPRETLVASIAFGPGLTLAGALLRKE